MTTASWSVGYGLGSEEREFLRWGLKGEENFAFFIESKGPNCIYRNDEGLLANSLTN
jgi:hypothetical protein